MVGTSAGSPAAIAMIKRYAWSLLQVSRLLLQRWVGRLAECRSGGPGRGRLQQSNVADQRRFAQYPLSDAKQILHPQKQRHAAAYSPSRLRASSERGSC